MPKWRMKMAELVIPPNPNWSFSGKCGTIAKTNPDPGPCLHTGPILQKAHCNPVNGINQKLMPMGILTVTSIYLGGNWGFASWVSLHPSLIWPSGHLTGLGPTIAILCLWPRFANISAPLEKGLTVVGLNCSWEREYDQPIMVLLIDLQNFPCIIISDFKP